MAKAARNFDLDEFISRLRNPQKHHKSIKISEDEVRKLCKLAKESFLQQDTLLRIKAPINVCGDVHGQFFDLLKLFHVGGCPSVTNSLFLGDYVDRGANSLETICLLLALKSKYPNTFFMVRGNHELAPINRVFGFFHELKRRFRYGKFMNLYFTFNDTFNYIPIAAIVDRSAFCCHGGISPFLSSLKIVADLKRPILPRKAGLASDIMWSDPDERIDEWEKQDQPETNPNHRGIGYLWGKVAHEKFLKENKLKMIIRAHECVDNGYQWAFEKQLITVFSAPNYSGGNYAAICTYHANGSLSFAKFK